MEDEENKNNSNVERKHIYHEDDNPSEEDNNIWEVDKIKQKITNHKYFIQNLEWVNVVQSLHELKLYVSYLLERDLKSTSSLSSSSNASSSEISSKNNSLSKGKLL